VWHVNKSWWPTFCQKFTHSSRFISVPNGLWCFNATFNNIGTHCIGSCKSNYHTIMTMMAPSTKWHHCRHKSMCKITFDLNFNQMADVQVHHRDLLAHSRPLNLPHLLFLLSILIQIVKKIQWGKFSGQEQVPVSAPRVIKQFIFYFNQYINSTSKHA